MTSEKPIISEEVLEEVRRKLSGPSTVKSEKAWLELQQAAQRAVEAKATQIRVLKDPLRSEESTFRVSSEWRALEAGAMSALKHYLEIAGLEQAGE